MEKSLIETIPNSKTIQIMKKENDPQTTNAWTETLSLLDYVCSQIANRYNLFSKGQPRKAAIIEVLARNTCIACADKELRTKSFQRIDNIYTELHLLACSMLVEELYDQLVKNGRNVTITTEENIKYGKIDVFIVPSNFGLSLHSNQAEIAIEVKTGFSLSLPQVLRYMIDNDRRSLILWRIRNQQVLLFESHETRQLLAQFVKMIISRADRLLLTPEPQCKHIPQGKSWSPNQEQLQETFSDFSKGITKTLPIVIEKVVTMLERKVN